MNRDIVRSSLVIVAGVLGMLGAAYGGGAFGTRPVNLAVDGWLDADSTLLAPATPAFSIWSVIYLGLAIYVVWQALPAQRTSARHRQLSPWIAASLLFNAIWILVVQADQLVLSLVVIVVLLGVLIRCWLLILQTPATSRADRWITDVTMGLYLGWVSVATVANSTAVLAAAGVNPGNTAGTVIASVLVWVAAAIGLAITWQSGRIAPVLAIVWGISWIGVGRETAPLDAVVAANAFIAALAALVGSALLALRRRREASRSSTPTAR